MNPHKHLLGEKWGRIVSPRSEREPAPEPAGSRAPGWTTHQYLKTASNRTCWKSSSILVWKSTFFSSLKPKLASKHTGAYFCTVQCLQQGPGVRGWGIVPLSTPKWPHDSVPRHRHPLLLANCFLNLSVTFNPHLHVPTEPELCTAPWHSLGNIPHVPATSKWVERGDTMECVESCRSTVKREDITGQATFK